MKGVWEVHECIKLRSAFQDYTTVISSIEIHANNCVSPRKLNHEKHAAEDQKLKINWSGLNTCTVYSTLVYPMVS